MSVFDTQSQLGLSGNLDLIGPCSLPGRLYDLGDYPGVLPTLSERDIVQAELYRFKDSQVLTSLDEFEDYRPDNQKDSLYLRKLIELSQPELRAWVYIYNKPIPENAYIECQSWIEYLKQKRQQAVELS